MEKILNQNGHQFIRVSSSIDEPEDNSVESGLEYIDGTHGFWLL